MTAQIGGLPDHARVYIWRSRAGEFTAPIYKHVALELCPHEGTREKRYISFTQSAHDVPSDCKKAEPHFHEEKSIDVKLFGEPNECYSLILDIQKIDDAYQKMMGSGFGKSLSVGIFHRPYPFSPSGVTAFLLDKGGIFNLTPYRKEHFFAEILKTIAIFGVTFGGLNYILAQSISLSMEQVTSMPKIFSRFNEIHEEASQLGIHQPLKIDGMTAFSLYSLWRYSGRGPFVFFRRYDHLLVDKTFDNLLSVIEYKPNNTLEESIFSPMISSEIDFMKNSVPKNLDLSDENALTEALSKNAVIIVPKLVLSETPIVQEPLPFSPDLTEKIIKRLLPENYNPYKPLSTYSLPFALLSPDENAVMMMKARFIEVAKYSFFIAAGAITLRYLINRFATEEYTFSHVERLAKIARKAQDAKVMRELHAKTRDKKNQRLLFLNSKVTYISFAGIVLASITALRYGLKSKK